MNSKILEQRAKAFDYLFDAVVVTDLVGTIIDWNKGAESLYGYTREEGLGQPVNILQVPEESDRITEEVISTVDKFGKWTGEIRMLHKGGHIGWVESMCVPIYDDNEQMIGALGIKELSQSA
jgi:PAS domain S-box-containing protein